MECRGNYNLNAVEGSLSCEELRCSGRRNSCLYQEVLLGSVPFRSHQSWIMYRWNDYLLREASLPSVLKIRFYHVSQ